MVFEPNILVLDRLLRLEERSGIQDGRLTHLELRSKQSEIKFDGLETKISEIIKVDHAKNGKIDLGQARERRPARLLPSSMLYG